MADLNRYAGNVVPFASNSTGTNRTLFGSIAQSDDIDSNINTDFKLGWEIVGSNEVPTKQDFNALGYTSTLLTAYLYQKGIPEWDTNQEYHTGSKAVGSDGMVYTSLTDSNTGNDPVSDLTNWLSEFSLYSMREVTHDITSDADYTLTAAQNFYKRIKITDTNPFLTTGINIIVNSIEREFVFENDSLQTLTVKTSAGTGIAVTAGSIVALRCDGTDVVNSDYVTGGQLGDVVHNATAKTTPVDADEFAVSDSASSFSLKKITWASIKNAIQSLIVNDYSITQIGHIYFADWLGGWVIQWGKVEYLGTDGATGTTDTFSMTFPNVVFKVVSSDIGSGVNITSSINASLSTVRVWGRTYAGTYADTSVHYIAVGR
jgi:hypothetical protein